MGSENNFALPLDLPSWNEGIKSLFAQPAMPIKDVAPAEDNRPAHCKNMGSVRRILAVNQGASVQVYHQKVIHDPHALHAQGLATLPTANDAEFWLRKASGLAPKEAETILMEALQRDVQPVTSIAMALHELHKTVENSPAGLAHLAIPTQGNDPLSLGGGAGNTISLTPGRTGLSGKAFRVPSRLANTPGAAKSHGAAAPQTKFYGILKKLQFSAAAPTAPTAPEEEMKLDEPTTTAPPPDAASDAAAAKFPATTTKRLQFESHIKSHETPATTTAAPTLPGGFKTSMRKVTFGGNTVSPSHNPPRRSSMMVGSFQTPSAIAEGGSGDEDDEDEEEASAAGGGSNGTVNSRNAGATPFDRRLSSLLTKYEDQPVENISAPDAGGRVVTTGTLKSPVNDLWKRLYSISPADSIKALSSGKMCSEEEAKESKKSDHTSSGNDRSSLESMSLAGSTPVVLVEASNNEAPIDSIDVPAVEEEKDAQDCQDISPNTAVASVLGDLLRRSLEDIEASKAAAAASAPRSLPSARDAISPSSGVLSTLPSALTPARSLTPMSIDGVARDEEGIPIATPSSVTLFRGAAQASQRNTTADDDDGFPADLFRGFTTPPEVADVEDEQEVILNTESVPDEPDFAFNLPVGSVRNNQTSPAAAAATTPGGASDTASEGTPDLKLKSVGGTGAKAGRHGPSPSFLRFTPTPSSVRKGDVQASFGKAERVPTPSPRSQSIEATSDVIPPPSLTKELRGLMQGMALSPAPAPVSLSPARASPMQQRELGVATVVTPVRRSPRVAASAGGTETGVTEMLEASGFVYVPNPALSSEKNTAAAAAGPSASGARKKKASAATPKTDENEEITPVSRYSLRRASKATNTKSKTGANRPGSGDKALKLSPTEQNIRKELRRSSRQERSTSSRSAS